MNRKNENTNINMALNDFCATQQTVIHWKLFLHKKKKNIFVVFKNCLKNTNNSVFITVEHFFKRCQH